MLSNVIVGPDEPVSFDGKSLFTNVPFSDTVTIIIELLAHDCQSLYLADLIEKYLTSTYNLLQGKLFQQNSGTPTDSPFSPVGTAFIVHYGGFAFDFVEKLSDSAPKVSSPEEAPHNFNRNV